MAVILIACGTAGAQEAVYQPGGDYIVGPAYGGDCGYGCDHGCGCDYGCGCADACCGTGCCDTSCCGSGCCDTCCDCCPCSWWEAGVGFYYLQPRWQNNPAAAQASTGVAQPFQERIIDFDYDAEFSPLVWIAYHHCSGIGARARYWTFDDDASVGPLAAVARSARPLGNEVGTNRDDEVLDNIASSLDVDVLDLELTKSLGTECWQASLSVGVRYARLEQTYFASLVNTVVQVGRIDSVHSVQRFEGVGPTLGVDLRGRMGCSDIWLYGLGRGALVYGTGTQNVNRLMSDVFTDQVAQRVEDFLPILELETGLEWRSCSCDREWFLNAGVLAQVWFGAGNSTDSSLGMRQRIEQFAVESRANMALLGLKLEGGVRF